MELLGHIFTYLNEFCSFIFNGDNSSNSCIFIDYSKLLYVTYATWRSGIDTVCLNYVIIAFLWCRKWHSTQLMTNFYAVFLFHCQLLIVSCFKQVAALNDCGIFLLLFTVHHKKGAAVIFVSLANIDQF